MKIVRVQMADCDGFNWSDGFPGQMPKIPAVYAQEYEKTLSVVMSTYNDGQGNRLRQAVDSVLSQTYQNFEFIICDDGSTDGTWALLKDFAKRDHRIRIIKNQKNKKAGYARNRAINLAKGKYIAIMDSDDVLHPKRFELQIKYLDEHAEYGFVGCRGQFFYTKINDEMECYRFLEAPQPRDMLFSLPFVHASCMFRREVLSATGGYDASSKRFRVEDYDLLLRIYEAGYRGANISKVLYYIRRDKNQYKRRKYRFRFHEAAMKYRACREFGMWPGGLIYVVKPLILGLLPPQWIRLLQKKYYRE